MTTPQTRTSSRDNGQLRRELARARATSRGAQATPDPPSAPPRAGSARVDRATWIRIMLSDSHSRNP